MGANENTTTGVVSASFRVGNTVYGSSRVNMTMEPFEKVTTTPSVGVLMPFEKLMETAFVEPSGETMAAFSQATEARVKEPI